MVSPTNTLHVTGLAKGQATRFARRAKSLGMTPERYLKHLVEEDLAISRAAKSTTFDALMGPGRQVDEEELDRLVEAAKSKHHASRKR